MTFGQLLVYLILVISVVMVWRGLWGLMDEYLFPTNRRRSYWVSFIIGFILISVFLSLVSRVP
ncbi:MAG: hypothetical protein QW179_02445 [Candidatus Hadarchaeales archaeon]